MRFRIIDQAPEPFAGSRGKGLQPRSPEVLDDLGLVERVLAAGVHHLPYRGWQGNRVEFATRLAGLAQAGDGVTATVVRGGVPEPLRAGFLVGCDGGHSTVRHLLGVGFQGETWETQWMLVGDVEAEGPDREHWHVWPYAQGGMVGLCPLPGSRLDIGAGPSTRPGGSSGAPAEGGGTGSLGGRDGRRAEWSLGPSPLRLGADG